MSPKRYVRIMRLIGLGVVVAGSVAIGRAMPVYREVTITTTKVERRTVVQTVKDPERPREYDDVCQGEPGKIIKVEAQDKDKDKGAFTYFLLQPVNDNWVVPCQIGGYWPEFKPGMTISIPNGKVSG